jgi:hypothetical protein
MKNIQSHIFGLRDIDIINKHHNFYQATNTIRRKSQVIFLNTWFLKLFTHLYKLFQQQKQAILFSVIKHYKRFRFKRLSPFLLTVLLLPAFFLYLFFEEKWIGNSVWMLFSSFVFMEINFLYIDFALWNYFKGKKKFCIWLIEAPLVFVSVYFFL